MSPKLSSKTCQNKVGSQIDDLTQRLFKLVNKFGHKKQQVFSTKYVCC